MAHAPGHVQGHVRRGSGKTLEAFPEDFDI
jgi:hypothetical protein